MIQLDGSVAEGGGAILRTALALSTLTGKAFEISNIRSNRPKPGLKAQHVQSLMLLDKLTKCGFTGCEEGSTKLMFIPGEIKAKKVEVDIGTAGSITLLLQSALLPCVFSGKGVNITVKGGTDVNWSIPADYLINVVAPHLRRLADIEVQIKKRGYYPKGQGEMNVKIKGQNTYLWQEINLTKKEKILSIRGISHASTDLLDRQVADKQADRAEYLLTGYGVPVTISRTYNKTESLGSGITLWAIITSGEPEMSYPVILGSSCLGTKNKKSEDVGREAALDLRKEIDSLAIVDKHLADQLIPYLGITKGKIITSKITNHTLANIYVTEKFLNVRFEIEGNTITAK